MALVVALSGAAVAEVATTSKLDKKEKKQTKRIANKQIKKKGPKLSVKNSKKLNGLKSDAYQSRVRWALVNSAADGNVGTILSQSGGVSVAAGIPGFSYLDWGEDIGNKALSVSIAQIGEGFATVTPCGGNSSPAGTTCVPAGTNDSNHTIVRMDTPGGAADNQTYFISVTE